jgi:hypothetical protein
VGGEFWDFFFEEVTSEVNSKNKWDLGGCLLDGCDYSLGGEE